MRLASPTHCLLSCLVVLLFASSAAQPVEEPILEVTTPQRLQDGSLAAIAVDRVRVDGPAWLVVHPEAPRGGPVTDEVLATEQVAAGDHADREVVLEEPIQEARTVFVMVYHDDPPRDEFDRPEGDPPVMRGDDILLQQVEVRSEDVAGGEATGDAGETGAPALMVTVLLLSALARSGARWRALGQAAAPALRADRAPPGVTPDRRLPRDK